MNRTSLVLALAALALLAFLGTRGLNEPDEGRYAEIGREMAASGDWLVPHLNGFPHFQKPPMLYWATAASITVLGPNEWAARLPSALAGFATVALTLWIGTLLFSPNVGRSAALILLSSLGFFALARLLTPDMTMTMWITAAIACFVRSTRRPQQRRWVWLFFVAMGLGFLTKGPMALIVPISAAVAWQVASRREPNRGRMPWVRGLTLSLLLAISWFVALSLWRRELFDYFWRYELVERFASSAHGRSKPFWFFLPVLFVTLIPWVFLLPTFFRRAWTRLRARRIEPWMAFLLGWVVPPFLLLSLSGSKLPTYILPLLPAFALAMAVQVGRAGRMPIFLPRVAGAALAVWIAAAAVIPHFNDKLEQQASLKPLLEPLANDPALRDARVYAVNVRAHGLEFYLRRVVSATEETSDIVLPLTPAEQSRLITTRRFKSENLLPAPGEPPVFALARSERAKKSFPAASWEDIGEAGDFILLRSRPAGP